VSLAVLGARVLLALVFAFAAVAKLRDRASSVRAMRDFGVPGPLARPAAMLLPIAEIAIAIALIAPAAAWWGSLAALGLLGVFSVAIAVNLARGNAPDCHCFGEVSGGPVGGRTLARNAVLASLAGIGLVGNDLAATVSLLGVDPAVALATALVAAVLVQAWLLLNVVAQNGRLLARVEALEQRQVMPSVSASSPARGLPVGTTAPPFTLPGLRGETLTLDALRAGDAPVLLVFSEPGCGPCNSLLPDLGRWQRDHASRLNLAIVTRDTAEANRAKSAEHGLRNVLLQSDREVAASYLVTGTPSAVLVASDGTIASALAEGADAITALVGRSTGALEASHDHGQCGNGSGMVSGGPKIGEPAPSVRLPDLDGVTVDLAELAGPTLLLFWDPNCGFCAQMLADLKRWEQSASSRVPRILMVSTGTVDANRALDVRSVVVLDQTFATARSFGVTGTPSAVLVDAQKRVASHIAVGAPAVLALASADRSAV